MDLQNMEINIAQYNNISAEIGRVHFKEILGHIAGGAMPSQEKLMPFLLINDKNIRADNNYLLALAYQVSGRTELSVHYIERAWRLSEFSELIFESYIQIHRTMGNISQMCNAAKRLGSIKYRHEDFDAAFHYFKLAHSYNRSTAGDGFFEDYDILDKIEDMASSLKVNLKHDNPLCSKRRINIGYLISGIASPGNVIVKHNLSFAIHHNRSEFNVTIFVLETYSSLKNSQHANKILDKISTSGCNLVYLSDYTSNYKRYSEMANKIINSKIDILVTNDLVGTIFPYFLIAIRPASLIISLNHGNPHSYSSHLVDHTISWTWHGQMESLSNGSLVKAEIDFSSISREGLYTKKDLGLSNKIVLFSSGRVQKFRDKQFWDAIIEVLKLRTDVVYVVAGPESKEIPIENDKISADVLNRIFILGWRIDCEKLLGAVDIYIDTYPEGGGFSMYEAMSLRIPTISFKNNYMQLFDQRYWSPALEVFCRQDLIVERGCFNQFIEIVIALIDDEIKRNEIGNWLYNRLFDVMSKPARMVTECEKIYKNVLKEYTP